MYIKIKLVYNNSIPPKKSKANGCSCEQVFGNTPNNGRGIEVYL